MKMIKSLYAIIPLLVILTTGCGQLVYTTNNSAYDDERNTFSDLDYYGQWINVSPFGDVWRPNSESNWRPYDNGQWELTDRGWMWFSDEPYGWIVYHYGYWAFTDIAGWVWIPGYDWSPSRVNWITQNDYIGWAPIPPSGWNRPNIYDTNGDRYWIIVRSRDFDNREIHKYRIGINSINDRRNWNSGRAPEPRYIRDLTGRNIEPINTQTDNVRGGKRDLTRVRIRGNEQNPTPSQPVNNPNNFTPPPVGRTGTQRPADGNNRTNTGDRNANPTSPNVPAPKTRGDLVEPKRTDTKPVEKLNEPQPVEPKRIDTRPVERVNEPQRVEPKRIDTRPVEKVNEPQRVEPIKEPELKRNVTPKTNVIRNEDNRKTRVTEVTKKPVTVDDVKKQKIEERQLKQKNNKSKILPKEKPAENVDKK